MKKTKELAKKHKLIALRVKLGYFLEALGATNDYAVGDYVDYNNKECYIIKKNKSFYDLSEVGGLKIYRNVNEKDFISSRKAKNYTNRVICFYKWRITYWFYIHLREEIVKSIGKHSY